MKYSRITQAPLPELRRLLRLPFIDMPQDDELSVVWKKQGDVAHWFSRSACSLYVLAHLRLQATGASVVTIWVPEYFCNESLTLLRNIGARLVFYPINEYGHPVVEEFSVITEDRQPDLFLLVHYFGEPAFIDGVLTFCTNNGAWLVEDAAHVLQPIAGVGEVGDCVLYSPHKHIAIPDGAVLVIRKDGPANLAEQENILKLLDQVVCDHIKQKHRFDWTIAIWLAKRVMQRLGIRIKRRLPAFALDTQVVTTANVPFGMSGLSKRLLSLEVLRLREYAALRECRATDWLHMLQKIYPSEICEVVTNQCTPYLTCVSVADQKNAENIYTRLYEAGIPVSTWPDLSPEVIDKADHGIAHKLRHTRIYLPVHQSIKANQIKVCGNQLRNLNLVDWSLKKIDSKTEWEDLWRACLRKSLPQTWEYGSAKSTVEGWELHRFVVFDDNEIPVAIFQVLVKGISVLGGVARINRGPLMLQADDDFSRLALNAITLLVRESKRYRWWMMQIAPFLPRSTEVEEVLHAIGFRKQPVCPMDSALFSLEEDTEKLMMRLNGKWRNCLRKGQKLGVKIYLDEGGEKYFQWLIDFYKEQQLQKGFEGTSNSMLAALARNNGDLYKFNIFLAHDGEDISKQSLLGVLVSIQYGDISEYIIGATNQKGRMYQANTVLLWESILQAKCNGCKWFDVGGLAENTPKGIAKFKKGLNSEPYHLVGEWRKWFWQ